VALPRAMKGDNIDEAPHHKDRIRMDTRLHTLFIALSMFATASASAQTEAPKPPEVAKAAEAGKPADTAKSADSGKKAGDACENAVAETVRRMRGKDAHEVQFIGAKRALTPTPGDETGVKGEGRYRSAAGSSVPFTYSCAYNAKTGATSGALFRETGTARASTERAWQPDLTHVSPAACETATAAALKDKYPRVGRIVFGSDSRQLRPAPNAHTSLEGKGAVERAPGMSAVPFEYACEIETRSGKVVGVKTSD
jgi:hypothetical protein